MGTFNTIKKKKKKGGDRKKIGQSCILEEKTQ